MATIMIDKVRCAKKYQNIIYQVQKISIEKIYGTAATEEKDQYKNSSEYHSYIK